ncbi:MAG: histidine phosphatase family protein [Dehalococcoidales bacterium]|nr:histidine phosphatase family protein [Dehalococcoidales bacterium]
MEAIGEKMPRLLLVRHGDTDFNANRRFMGHSDIELSPLGMKQVTRLKDYIADEPVTAVFASDLKRTMMTASILAQPRGLSVIPCPELRELHYGECEGLSFEQIGIQYPEVAAQCMSFTLDLNFPGGEKYRGFIKRVRSFVKKLKAYNPKDTILIVAHSGPITALLCHFLGLPMRHAMRWRIDTASLSIVYYDPPDIYLTRFNDISYLKDRI